MIGMSTEKLALERNWHWRMLSGVKVLFELEWTLIYNRQSWDLQNMQSEPKYRSTANNFET